jgi:predicted peptidase
MKRIAAIILVVMMFIGWTAIGEEVLPEYTFNIHSKVFDYHDSVVAVVIMLDFEVETDSLTTRTFSVFAKSIDKQHGNDEIYFEGNRTITDIYTNNSGLIGDKATSGNYIVIELKHGANVDEAVICPYFADTYRQSALLTLEYTLTQHADVGMLKKSTSYKQGVLKTETVDEFAYGEGNGVSYRLFTPKMTEGESYPLVVWLHGFGERGTDNETVLRSNRGGVAWAEDRVQTKHPSFVMAAQANSMSSWSGEGMINGLIQNIYDILSANPSIDSNRIYVTGVSSGGFGTMAALRADPDLFAAAMPLAGGFTVVGDDGFITNEYKEILAQFTEKPIYFIHGDGDPVVNIHRTSNPTYQYLKEVVGNPNVIFTKIKDASYAGRDHYTLHNVEVRLFNHDVVFNTSYSRDNPSGDISIPYERNDSGLTPIDWIFSQSK